MIEGLIESIKNAEKTSVERKAQAEKRAEQRMRELRESHKKDLQALESGFLEERNKISSRALQMAGEAINEKRKAHEVLEDLIKTKGSKNRNDAIGYIINKILE